jgi:hypothetical protein
MKHEVGISPSLASHGVTAVIAAAVCNRGRVGQVIKSKTRTEGGVKK